MSVTGHFQKSGPPLGASAPPSGADILRPTDTVRFVPTGDIDHINKQKGRPTEAALVLTVRNGAAAVAAKHFDHGPSSERREFAQKGHWDRATLADGDWVGLWD